MSNESPLPQYAVTSFEGDLSKFEGRISRYVVHRAADRLSALLPPKSGTAAPDDTTSRPVQFPWRSASPSDARRKVVDFPEFRAVPRTVESFAALQEWEGEIEAVSPTGFTASLIDITGGCYDVGEIVDIPMSDVEERDTAFVRRGALFRWVIGYAKTPSGVRTRGSRLYFRREQPKVSTVHTKPLVFETIVDESAASTT